MKINMEDEFGYLYDIPIDSAIFTKIDKEIINLVIEEANYLNNFKNFFFTKEEFEI